MVGKANDQCPASCPAKVGGYGYATPNAKRKIVYAARWRDVYWWAILASIASPNCRWKLHQGQLPNAYAVQRHHPEKYGKKRIDL